jgi:aspartate racemase
MWTIAQVLPDLPLFNIPYVLRLRGLCRVDILQQSCSELIKRHEALRTTFAAVDGRPVQVIAPTVHIPLRLEDLRPLPEAAREEAAQRLAAEEAQEPFDLARGPLLRLRLLHLHEQEYLLLVTLHHSICDGWSMGIFVHELAVVYDALAAGQPPSLPALPIQYADFAHWQRQWRHNAEMAAQLAYWQERLRAPRPALNLPTDRPRGTALSFRTARQTLVLPAELSAALKALSQHTGSTLFMTLLAALDMLLYGYTGQEDLRVATLVANRNRRDTERLIGLLVNTVILRTDLSGNPTCREVLQRVRATTLGAYAHQDLPFEELLQTLEQEGDFEPASLAQVLVIWQNAMLRPVSRSAHTASFLAVDSGPPLPPLVATTFDITLMLYDRPPGITGTCIYQTDLFEAATIERLLAEFQQGLETMLVCPEQPLSTFRRLANPCTPGAQKRA